MNQSESSGRHPEDYPRAALVTGGGQRIGREIAQSLADEGWAVAVHYKRSAKAAAALVAEIEQAGGRAVALEADLAREQDSAALVPRQRTCPPLAVGN